MEVDQDQRLTAQEAINHEWFATFYMPIDPRNSIKLIMSRSSVVIIFVFFSFYQTKHSLAQFFCDMVCFYLRISMYYSRLSIALNPEICMCFSDCREIRREMKHSLQSVTVIQLKINLVCNSLWQSQTDEAESSVLKWLFSPFVFCICTTGSLAAQLQIRTLRRTSAHK